MDIHQAPTSALLRRIKSLEKRQLQLLGELTAVRTAYTIRRDKMVGCKRIVLAELHDTDSRNALCAIRELRKYSAGLSLKEAKDLYDACRDGRKPTLVFPYTAPATLADVKSLSQYFVLSIPPA